MGNIRYDKSSLWLYFNNKVFLDFKFDPIISYLTESSSMIERKGVEIKHKFDTWEKEHRGNLDAPDAFDMYEQDLINHEKFPELLNNSMFLVIYSMFETHYHEFCKMISQKIDCILGVNDLAGSNYLTRCLNFLEKVVGIDLTHLNPLWEQIKNYQNIRNSIAHNQGKLQKINPAIQRFAAQKPGIEIINRKIFIKETSFLISFIELIKEYFVNLNKVLVEHFRKK
ncbi:hypothetical protein B0O79_3368 [Flavobacteriaceae bacterium MAR_2009_75]|nr:hypothetical protein B0O79_3368 [Flavobacteriaceae bacterium MAR_2009_75]